MTLEVDIEDKVVQWAQRHKFLTPKVKFVEVGYPDRLFISPYGHTIFIEFKKPGEVPKPIQEHRLNQLRSRGVPAVWCDSVHEAIGILKASLETAVGPPSLPNEGDQASVVAGVRRAIPRPGSGEDIYGLGGVQNLAPEESRKENVDHSPQEAGPKDVARRTGEVVKLLRPSAYNSTWGSKGPKS